jgi:hypothetical protein
MKTPVAFLWTTPRHPLTTQQWEGAVNRLFHEIAGQLGSFEARRIFTQCARPLTKRDKQLNENATLLWEYINMPRRSIRQLATRLAKENGIDQRALEKKIERAVKNKKVRAYLRESIFQISSEYPTF